MESSQKGLVARRVCVRSWLSRAVVAGALAVAGIVVLNGSSSVMGNVLVRAECPGNDVVWKYSIGAPGYAIASGAYPANG